MLCSRPKFSIFRFQLLICKITLPCSDLCFLLNRSFRSIFVGKSCKDWKRCEKADENVQKKCNYRSKADCIAYHCDNWKHTEQTADDWNDILHIAFFVKSAEEKSCNRNNEENRHKERILKNRIIWTAESPYRHNIKYGIRMEYIFFIKCTGNTATHRVRFQRDKARKVWFLIFSCFVFGHFVAFCSSEIFF